MNFIGSPKQAFEMLNFPIKKWKPCFSGTCQKVEDWLWLFSRSYINHHHHHIFAIISTESKLKYILLTRDMWRTRGQLTNPKGTWMCRVLNYCYSTAKVIDFLWDFYCGIGKTVKAVTSFGLQTKTTCRRLRFWLQTRNFMRDFVRPMVRPSHLSCHAQVENAKSAYSWCCSWNCLCATI